MRRCPGPELIRANSVICNRPSSIMIGDCESKLVHYRYSHFVCLRLRDVMIHYAVSKMHFNTIDRGKK